MKKLVVLLALLFAFLEGTAYALTPLMPVENLRVGMKGYAKTVISGDTIETFPIEVLGVTGDENSGYQILIKAGGSLIERSGGIAQGMSGSPVYIDGRLVGAVAYGRAFNDPHYCFLTPIQNMLEMLDKPVPHKDNAGKDPALLPKGTRLMAGGFSSVGFAILAEELQPFDLAAVDVGPVGTVQVAGNLEPGSSVGVALVQGDLSLGALGTVTWTDDKGRLLAFGHPFVQRGDASFFMTKTWVLASLPNLQTAYKVGNLGQAVGTVNQDRAAGVAGTVGKLPKYIPLYVSASDMTRSLNRGTRVKIVEDEQLAPGLIASVVASEAAKAADHAVGGSARILFDIMALDSQNNPLHILRENMYYDTKNIIRQLPQELQEASQVLLQNKLEKVNITNINVTVDLSTDSLVAEIQRASVQEKEPKPGDTIHLDVVMKPYRSAEITRTVAYKLPKDASGNLKLNVRGGASRNWIQQLLRQQKEEGVPQVKERAQEQEKRDKEKKKEIRLRDYVREINKADRNNDIIVEYAVKESADSSGKSGRGMAGQAAEEEIPLTFSALLAGGRNKQSTPIDLIVDGETGVTVKIAD